MRKKTQSVRKIFVLDTSTLVYDPQAYLSFIGNDVILAITVLDELDHIKKFSNEAGRNARVAIRNLDAISNVGEIHIGINIENDIMLKIDTSAYGSLGSDPTYGDSKILACAAKLKEISPDRKVILVSKDINLRTRAKAFGLMAQDYEKDKIQSSEIYEGFRTVKDEEAGAALAAAGVISVDDNNLSDMSPNECVLFLGAKDKGIAAGRRVGKQIKLIKDQRPWNLELRNKEQLFAADMIMDKDISLVSIVGVAGSGKTLTTMACALEAVINKKMYEKIIIYRPMLSVGSEIGFIPGDIDEKLAPWFGAIDDAMAFLCPNKSSKKDNWTSQLFQYVDSGVIQKEALTFIRGRSLNNAFIIVDEAQNLSKEEAKTVITRVGVGSKLVISGDISQIDNNYLDATNNGLSVLVDFFRTSNIAGHITFLKGERSSLATLAAEMI